MHHIFPSVLVIKAQRIFLSAKVHLDYWSTLKMISDNFKNRWKQDFMWKGYSHSQVKTKFRTVLYCLVLKKNNLKFLLIVPVVRIFGGLTSATLIHFSRSCALCWLPSFVGQRQDARTVLASLLNWRMVARTDQQTSSLPFLSLCDHSEPRQW